MAEKIMLNVVGVVQKKVILPAVMKLGYDFVEYTNFDDLKFKLELLKDQVALIIHELNYQTYRDDFKNVADLTNAGYRILVYTEKYDPRAIDDAIYSGAMDMINSPLKESILSQKIDSILQSKPKKEVVAKDFGAEIMTTLEHEINRAGRGGYSLSLVLAEFSGIKEDEIQWLMDELRKKLRETDLVLQWSHNALLQICPFTDKFSIVEVENKIRGVLKEHYMSFRGKINLFMYGISYPKDSTNRDDLVNMLKDGLRNSIFLGSLRGGFNDIGKADVEYYRRMFGKK